MKKFLILLPLIFLTACGNANNNPTDSNMLNVYSSRNYDIDKQLFEKFTQETGIEINLLESGNNELFVRLEAERNNPIADVFIGVTSATLAPALNDNLLAPHGLQGLHTVMEYEHFGDNFIALTTRARIPLTHVDNPISISSYLDLTDERFADSILVRSSTNAYNVMLVAALIQNYGEDYAREFSEGIARNLSREPQGNDRDQARAMIAGEGTIAIMNTYYVQNLLDSADSADVRVGEQLTYAFPDVVFEDITWAAIVNGSDNVDNAALLLEFLIREDSQNAIMVDNGELPIIFTIPIAERMRDSANYTPMPIDYSTLGNYTIRATMIMNEAGWR